MNDHIQRTLTVDDFAAFHLEVHNCAPFDWQKDLLEKVVEERGWPRVLDIPTGAGKTTCIDIALFALALDAGRAPEERWCPRRIAMVVDRRIVVDQVAERGRRLLRALTAPDASELVAAVADRLRPQTKYSPAETALDPIGVYTLRGGMPRDDGWARTPDQPLVIASTVDQIGSRLLMQGYGVSNSMKPVHAGLAGNDILILLDEVHLSQAFATTLEALQRLRSRHARSSGIASRFQYAFLSATPGHTTTDPFRLEPHKIDPDSVLGRRLHAPKPTRLVEVASDVVERSCAIEALKFSERHRVVAVVVNRVAAASRIAEDLDKGVGSDTDVVLVTGRMRPLDRDEILRDLRPRVMSGRSREQERRLIVVATQCVEAGADFDFDALVTEAASLTALRQRFGRLDRLGAYRNAEAVVIRNKGLKDDPIYGESTVRTWAWLKQAAADSKTVDFGILALPLPAGDELLSMSDSSGGATLAPTLLPAYLDIWAQTAPPPTAMPEVALWLHGVHDAPAEVQVVWRADVTSDDLRRGYEGGIALQQLIAVVGAIRPSSLEAVSVPISAARRWLRQDEPAEIADVERSADEDFTADLGNMALRWDGERSAVVLAKDLRPGDTIIVPAKRGGIAKGSFEPRATDPVSDLAEKAALLSRGQSVLRLNREVLKHLELTEVPEDVDDILEFLQDSMSRETRGWRIAWLEGLVSRRPKQILIDADEPSTVLEGKRIPLTRMRDLLQDHDTHEAGVEPTTDEDTSPYVGRRQRLSEHSHAVEHIARSYAHAAGLPTEIVNDIALAAWLHDIGKADRRFQIMLHGGDDIGYFKNPEPLAKSGISRSESSAQRIAHRKSGYPSRARHEVQSLALVESNLDVVRDKAHDLELVLYLIASHHGHCRPFAPVINDDAPVTVSIVNHASPTYGSVSFTAESSRHDMHRIDSPLADRFWRMITKYGWQELCWLEAILRLADHRASEMNETTPEQKL